MHTAAREPATVMLRESEFTAPHEVAPHPEWWHSSDSDSTEYEVSVLIGALVRALQPEYVVETGSHLGYTTHQIALALRANQHGRGISLEVDPVRVDAARELIGRDLLESWIEIREQSSLEFTPEQTIDLLFCDSLYELRPLEIERYRPWLRSGHSVVAIHDWTSGIRGHYRDVREDCERMKRDGLIEPIFLPTPRGIVLATIP